MWRRLTALCAWGLISAGVTCAGATTALADSAGCAAVDSNGGCSATSSNDRKRATKLTTTQTSALAVTSVSTFVNATVKSRFGVKPSPKPQSFSAVDQKADVDQELKQVASVLPADMLVPAARQALNEGNFDRLLIAGAKVADKALDAIGRPYGLWLRGRSAIVDNERSGGAYDGTALSLAGGADYKFHNDMLAGLAVAYERGDIDTTFNTGDLTSEGATVAPYIGWRPIPALTLDANIGVSALDYTALRSDGAAAARFDAFRMFGSLNGTGAFHFGSLRVSPTAGLQYFQERQDGYTDSSGLSISEQTVGGGRLSSGMEIGYTLEQEYIGFGLEPYVRSSGEWDFGRPVAVALTTGETVRPARYGGNLAGGLNLFNDKGLTGKLEGSLDNIGRADDESATIQGSVRYGF